MTQVDFYQLTRDPPEQVLPPIAQKILDSGGRLLIVCADQGQMDGISAGLWGWKAESFLGHGMAGDALEKDQPILLSEQAVAANGAQMVALADGVWRDDALVFERAFYLFPPDKTDNARDAWRALADKDGVMRKYWKQDGGKWRQGP